MEENKITNEMPIEENNECCYPGMFPNCWNPWKCKGKKEVKCECGEVIQIKKGEPKIVECPKCKKKATKKMPWVWT